MPRMMRSIVGSAVASQPDMQVAGNCEDWAVEEAVARYEADVLIVEEQAGRPEEHYRTLLLTYPSLKVFVLTQDCRNATLMGFRRVRFADASPTTLIEAIRSELQQEAKPGES